MIVLRSGGKGREKVGRSARSFASHDRPFVGRMVYQSRTYIVLIASNLIEEVVEGETACDNDDGGRKRIATAAVKSLRRPGMVTVG